MQFSRDRKTLFPSGLIPWSHYTLLEMLTSLTLATSFILATNGKERLRPWWNPDMASLNSMWHAWLISVIFLGWASVCPRQLVCIAFPASSCGVCPFSHTFGLSLLPFLPPGEPKWVAFAWTLVKLGQYWHSLCAWMSNFGWSWRLTGDGIFSPSWWLIT